jgi:hypothetical protein
LEVAAVSIRHHAKSETIPEAVKPGMLGRRLESMIAYPNVSHREILKRTQIHCERPSASTRLTVVFAMKTEPAVRRSSTPSSSFRRRARIC